MAIFRFSNAGGFGTYQRYNDFLAGNPAVVQDPGAYFPLGEFTLAAAQANVEFTNIPQTYTHLQLRCNMRLTGSNSSDGSSADMQFNGDTTSVYALHFLYGNGSSALAGNEINTNVIRVWRATTPTQSADIFGTAILDILDYRNTNKFKTVRYLSGFDGNGSGLLSLSSGLWRSSTAITSIKLTPPSNFATNSSFQLYGVLA